MDSPPLISSTASSATQTSKHLSAHSPRKESLKETVRQLQIEKTRLKNEIENLTVKAEKHLDDITLEQYKILTYKYCPSKEVGDFINTQVSQGHKQAKARRYTPEFKHHCLSMYLMGPKLYKRNLMQTFCLPGPRTLLKYVGNLKINAGLNEAIFYTLKLKVENFTDENKLCSLCVDEISIKSHLFYQIGLDEVIGFEDFGEDTKSCIPATHATVLMVKGIQQNWKQPLAYFFVNSACPAAKLKVIILDAIRMLKGIDLKVCAVISDMGSNNVAMSALLNITPENPYFFVDDMKIVYIFDPPHLLKATRNNLLKYKFLYEGQTVSWEHIKHFYDRSFCFILNTPMFLQIKLLPITVSLIP